MPQRRDEPVEHQPDRQVAEEPIGLIAGRGEFPLEFCRQARRNQVPAIAAVAMYGETSAEIERLAHSVDWAYPGQLRRAIKCLKRRGVKNVVFAGQIKPARLFRGLRPDLKALKLLWRIRERNADTIFSAAANEFEKSGIHVLPSITFMDEALADGGLMGRVRPNPAVLRDIEYGTRIAREVSRLNIGQTVVVKRGTILAVEGFEGTDKTIRRGGELGRGKVTVVKVAKPNHDLRFDVPCIGMRTVESLKMADARALAVQAGMSLFLRREDVLNACDAAGIVVYGIDIPYAPADDG